VWSDLDYVVGALTAFVYVDLVKFTDFEQFHARRISHIVMPWVLIEAGSALALLLIRPTSTLLWLNLLLLVGIWGVTFFGVFRATVDLREGMTWQRFTPLCAAMGGELFFGQ